MDVMIGGAIFIALGTYDSFIKNRSLLHMFLSLCFKTFGLLLIAVGFWVFTSWHKSPASFMFYVSSGLILLCASAWVVSKIVAK